MRPAQCRNRASPVTKGQQVVWAGCSHSSSLIAKMFPLSLSHLSRGHKRPLWGKGGKKEKKRVRGWYYGRQLKACFPSFSWYGMAGRRRRVACLLVLVLANGPGDQEWEGGRMDALLFNCVCMHCYKKHCGWVGTHSTVLYCTREAHKNGVTFSLSISLSLVLLSSIDLGPGEGGRGRRDEQAMGFSQARKWN